VRRQNPNLAATEAIARRLGPLLPRFVFVGGCATGLLITDPASAPVRVTKDVDVIAELASYGEYSALGEQLRTLGFREDDSEGAPVCRRTTGDLLLDVMPTTGSPLGFTNRWYVEAIRQSRDLELAPGVRIRLVTGPLFLATKFEAFLARGHGDYYMSQDLEDVISVVDGRMELAEELKNTVPEVRAYLATQFSTLLADGDFLDSLPGHFPGDETSQERIHIVLSRLRGIATITVSASGR
jgi:predicted nucleotidyltransferase